MAAKKKIEVAAKKSVAKSAPAKAAVASSPVRNSPVPKVAKSAAKAAAPVARQVTQDDIARKAYEIWASGQGGSEYDNWVRAERELRGM